MCFDGHVIDGFDNFLIIFFFMTVVLLEQIEEHWVPFLFLFENDPA